MRLPTDRERALVAAGSIAARVVVPADRVRSPSRDVADEETKVCALNLFDIADREEYLAYSRRSAREVARHGGRVLALGRFRKSRAGGITPRQLGTPQQVAVGAVGPNLPDLPL